MMMLETILQRLSYNPLNGEFRYKVAVSNMKAGDLAGRPNTNGHIQISINGKRYMAHNLAWFVMTGEWPNFIVDHRDCDAGNNAWYNLRRANGQKENQGNRRIQSNNTTGFKGVTQRPSGAYAAQIVVNGKKRWLGSYATAELAKKAYDEASKQGFGEFHRHA